MRRVKIERGEREIVRRILCRMISIGGTVRLDCILQLGTPTRAGYSAGRSPRADIPDDLTALWTEKVSAYTELIRQRTAAVVWSQLVCVI